MTDSKIDGYEDGNPMTKNILILPGDYIGGEIMAEAVKILEVLRAEGEDIAWSFGKLGGAAYDADGHPYPPSTQKAARAADAILLGAVGGPKYDNLPREVRPERGLLGIRKDLNLFANLRPALSFDELADASSLKREVVEGLDIVIDHHLRAEAAAIAADLFVLKVRPDARIEPFVSGQYVLLGLSSNRPRREGREPEFKEQKPDRLVLRAYSIASAGHETDALEFYISVVSNGSLTPRLVQLEPGDRLNLGEKIRGHFTLHAVPEDREWVVLAATGTGLAPYISMMRAERLKPSNQIEGSAYRMAHTLPKTEQEALSRFMACKPIRSLLGEKFIKALYIVKTAELAAYQNVISSWEREHLLLNV